jgi:zinc/manganese transport system substrate-binding protein
MEARTVLIYITVLGVPMHRLRTVRTWVAPLVLVVLAAACGSDDDADGDVATARGTGSTDPAAVTIAVTTSVLGDVVTELVGDLGEVVTIMPPGANPHGFQASARQAAALADADVIVVNGGGFEEGLLSVVEGAESDGVPVLDAVELLGGGEGDDHGDEGDDHGDEGDDHADDEGDDHGDEGDDHGDEGDDHAHDGDAHFFTDPIAVAEVVDALADQLPAEVPGIDAAQLRSQADDLVAELEALDAELRETLVDIPEDQRVLVTDHDVLGSFADRYDFEVIATVIPSGSTSDGVSGGALAELAQLLRDTGVPAVFTEETAAGGLSETLATEAGDVEVVALYAESLGPEDSEAATYAAMMRTNAERIADALAG